jgi:hypothetical protein
MGVFTHEKADLLLASEFLWSARAGHRPALPQYLFECVKERQKKEKAKQLRGFRDANLARIREKAKKTAKENEELVKTAAPHVQKILRKTGINLVLLKWCLKEFCPEYEDMDIVDEFLRGCKTDGPVARSGYWPGENRPSKTKPKLSAKRRRVELKDPPRCNAKDSAFMEAAFQEKI